MSLAGYLGPVAAAGLFVPILWLSWRKPSWPFLLARAALAIHPQLLWGGPALGYEWGLHHTLLVYPLGLNALRYGVRRTRPGMPRPRSRRCRTTRPTATTHARSRSSCALGGSRACM